MRVFIKMAGLGCAGWLVMRFTMFECGLVSVARWAVALTPMARRYQICRRAGIFNQSENHGKSRKSAFGGPIMYHILTPHRNMWIRIERLVGNMIILLYCMFSIFFHSLVVHVGLLFVTVRVYTVQSPNAPSNNHQQCSIKLVFRGW